MSLPKWKNKYVIDIYVMAKDGYSDRIIAKSLGVTCGAFSQWKSKHKGVVYALKRGKIDKKKSESFDWQEYIYGRLPEKLRPVWTKIMVYSKMPDGYLKAEKLLSGKDERLCQELFIYALLWHRFNVSKALRKCAINRKVYTRWLETDPDFVDLVNEVHQIQKDFYEESLIKLVRAGDSVATIMANKTFNKDRGYAEKIEIDHSHTLTVTTIPLGELDLPPEILRAVLKAMRDKDKLPAGMPLPPAKQIESVVVENEEAA